MRLGFDLEVTLFRVAAIVLPQRALDVDGVRVVSLDQVAVVAVHRAHERCQRAQQTRWQRAAQAGAALGQFEREVGQFDTVARPLAQNERFHQGGAVLRGL